MNNPSLRVGAVALGALVAASALSGCTPVSPPPALTIAVTATSAEPAPALDLIHEEVVAHAVDSLYPGDGVVRVVVQGDSEVHQVDLTPMRGDEVETAYNRVGEKVDELLPELVELLEGVAADTDGNNPLAVLDAALEATPEGGTIVMLSSGISTESPVSLPLAGAWIEDPIGFADAIAAVHLPDASGRSIRFAGLGYSWADSTQPTAGPASRTALTDMWLRICERMNAEDCAVLDGPPGGDEPSATNVVPVVTLETLTTTCVGSVLIEDVAFGPNSPVLVPAAAAQLDPIVKSLLTCPTGRVVDGFGHAAEVPGEGDGVALSLDRCEAVFAYLGAAGVPSTTLGRCVGLGSTSGQIVDNTPNGVYDESLARLNRVVELVVRST